MKSIEAIKKYFGQGEGARPVEMSEVKALGTDGRQELGALACAAMGVPFEANEAAAASAAK